MRRLLHRALLQMASALDPCTASQQTPSSSSRGSSLTASPPTAPAHPLDVVLELLSENPAQAITEDAECTTTSLSSKLLAAALATLDDNTHQDGEPLNRHLSAPSASDGSAREDATVSSDVAMSLFRSLLSGELGRHLRAPALAGPLFPWRNHLTYHTSPFARTGATTTARHVHSTLTAAHMEQRVANHIAQRLGLPRRFFWSETLRETAASPRPALGLRQHTWAPVVTDARGEQHMVEASTSSRLQVTVGGATLALGQGTATEARALFSFERPSPAKAVPARRTVGTARAVVQAGAEGRDVRRTDEGGGIVYTSTLEAYLCLLHTARTQALARSTSHRLTATTTGTTEPTAHLVLYASDQADPQLFSAARLLGFQHVHAFQTVMAPQTGQYAVSAEVVKRQIVDDLSRGLFPCLVVAVLGARCSGAVDPLDTLASFCHKTGVWFHVDGSAGGLALLASPEAGGPSSERLRAEGGGYQQRGLAEEADGVYTAVCTALAHADSLFVSLQHGAIASCTTGRSADAMSHAVLFLAHAAKLAWALTHTLAGPARVRESTSIASAGGAGAPMNGWYFPTPGTHHHALDALHLVPPSERRGAGLGDAVSLAIQLLVTSPLPSAAAVRRHQDTLAALHLDIAADGRFDAPFRGSALFGFVLFRGLTYTDEAAVQLAESWRDVLAEWAVRAPPSTRLVLPLSVGLVAVQKRVWLSVSLSDTVTSSESGKALVNHTMESLREAARRCGP